MKTTLLWGAIWGFAEATLFFILPDVGLTRTALFSFRRACWQALAALMGAVIGGLLLWQWGHRSPARAEAWIRQVPFVRPWMVAQAHVELAQEGSVAMIHGPRRGIPYKLYAVQAPAFMSFQEFLWMSFPARAWRFLAVILIAGGIGFYVRRQYPRAAAALTYGHIIVWLSFYVIYWNWVMHR